MRSLHELGRQHGTDKHDEAHSFRHASYLDFYQRHLGPVRHLLSHVLEIGVWKGASLYMWRDYFPNAVIHGMDIDPAAAFTAARIDVTIGRQDDLGLLSRLADGASLDLVVDDGSHVVDHIVTSFRALWPRVRPGGFYIIEDLGQSRNDITESLRLWPGQAHNTPDTNYRNDRSRLVTLFEELLAHMDNGHGDCAGLYHYPRVVVIEKAV